MTVFDSVKFTALKTSKRQNIMGKRRHGPPFRFPAKSTQAQLAFTCSCQVFRASAWVSLQMTQAWVRVCVAQMFFSFFGGRAMLYIAMLLSLRCYLLLCVH
jgi:hypothetical protein